MDLGEMIAREVIRGLLDFKPEKIRFFGTGDLVFRVMEAFKIYSSEVSISKDVGLYLIDVDALAKYQKPTESKEVSFKDYWGTEVIPEERFTNKLFKSRVPLNEEGDKVYRIVGITTKSSAFKIIPLRYVGKDLVSSGKGIYVLARQHLEDEEFLV